MKLATISLGLIPGHLQSRLPRTKTSSSTRIGRVPQGSRQTQGLPDTFVQSKSHLDTLEVFGKTLLRKIAPTSWSFKHGLAGQNIEQVKLVDLLWRGWHNQHLRALSHGSYMSLLVDSE